MTRTSAATRVASALLSTAVLAGVVALTSQESDATAATAVATTTTAASATPAPAPAAATADTSTSASTDTSDTTAALDALTSDGRFAVSVLDVATGETFSYGDTGTFDTASIVKVDILAALLWQHQEEGDELTASELSSATAMIERSDNDAATTLFRAVGGESGLEAFNATIGLTETDVGSDGNWGLTQTTADDQVRLLEVVFGDDSVLDAASQQVLEDLMSDVVDSQRFGVSAAADDADDTALKVGYLQRSTTGLWDVTSIGRVEAGGRTYLVAVLTDGSSTLAGGAALTDDVAEAAVAQAAADAI